MTRRGSSRAASPKVRAWKPTASMAQPTPLNASSPRQAAPRRRLRCCSMICPAGVREQDEVVLVLVAGLAGQA
jgi:hypothetical protein